VNTVGKHIPPGTVKYYLYMQGGFITYNPGDRVRVAPPPALLKEVAKKEETIFDHMSEVSKNSDDSSEESGEEEESEHVADEESVSSAGIPKKVKYIPKVAEKKPYKGEIIGVRKYVLILVVLT
jgi:hypothetical protein